jgi:hypothetical protein
MTRVVLPAARDQDSGGAVLPVYLGLYLVLLAFFVYFVAVSAAERRTEATVADDVAGIAAPIEQVRATEPVPALRPLADALRPVALPGGPGERNEPDRLDAAVAVDRIFVGETATLRPDFAPVLDRVAKELTSPIVSVAAPVAGNQAAGETLDLQLLVGLPPADEDGGPVPVADILAERLAVSRAAALARALLARGTPPEAFAVGVAPGAGPAVRFLFQLDPRDAVHASGD